MKLTQLEAAFIGRTKFFVDESTLVVEVVANLGLIFVGVSLMGTLTAPESKAPNLFSETVLKGIRAVDISVASSLANVFEGNFCLLSTTSCLLFSVSEAPLVFRR